MGLGSPGLTATHACPAILPQGRAKASGQGPREPVLGVSAETHKFKKKIVKGCSFGDFLECIRSCAPCGTEDPICSRRGEGRKRHTTPDSSGGAGVHSKRTPKSSGKELALRGAGLQASSGEADAPQGR